VSASLTVEGVWLSFGERAVLRDVWLHLEAGEVVALHGPSGSGKSTLLRVVAGLLRPDAGRVVVGDRDVTTVPTHRRSVGLMFQDEQLFPHRSVAGNVTFGLQMQRVPRAARRTRASELLALVGLAGFEDRDVTSLSGGEAKRVALARALAPQPAVLLLDEPLTGLDPELHERLLQDLRRVLDDQGTTAVHVTHDRDEGLALADRVVHLAELSGRRAPAD
jgi:thiamine transport system ATP-binding protein